MANNENRSKKVGIHETIVETLGRRIVSGDLAPGQSLGGDITMGDAFNASRTAMREALKILSSKGLIESRPKLGTIVKQRRDWNMLDPKVLEWSLQDPKLWDLTMTEIFGFRMAFEPYAAFLAATNHTDEDKLAIRRALRGMAFYVDVTDKAECDLAFHQAILKATGNSMFQAVGEIISVSLRHLFRAGLEATSKEDERWLQRHRAVADAIDARDAALSQELMCKLLNEGKKTQSAKLSVDVT